MTLPLTLQIQQAALDGKSSLTDALRRAKIACIKLGLTEFGGWVDKELNGYMEVPNSELPEYRKIYGRVEVLNRYHGWNAIQFQSSQQEEMFSLAPVGFPISLIEDSVPQDIGKDTSFNFQYPSEIQAMLRSSMPRAADFRIKLELSQIRGILNAVRNILLEWTIDLEKQGVLGENLTFTSEERERSAVVTANTVNHISIGQVGSFVQNAQDSVVQGTVESTTTLSRSTLDLVQQVEALLPASNLLPAIHNEAQAALGELREAANAPTPESGRLKKGLETLKRVLAPAGESLLKYAVDAAVTKILGHS
jgi:hypothetical protein